MTQEWRKRRQKAQGAQFFKAPIKPDWDNSLASEFKRYWERIHPDPLQRPSDEGAQFMECRRAFYAAAFVMICKMRTISEPHISEDAAVDHFEAVARDPLETPT